MAVAFSAGGRGQGGAQQLRGRPQRRDCGGWRRAIVRCTLGRRAAWWNYKIARAMCLVFLLPPRMQPPPLLLPRHHRCCRLLPLLSDHDCCINAAGQGLAHAMLCCKPHNCTLPARAGAGAAHSSRARPVPALTLLLQRLALFLREVCLVNLLLLFLRGHRAAGKPSLAGRRTAQQHKAAVGRGSVLPCPPEPTSWRTLTTRALCPVSSCDKQRQSAMTRHLPSSSSPRRAPSPAAPL